MSTKFEVSIPFELTVNDKHPIGAITATMSDEYIHDFVEQVVVKMLEDANKGGTWAILDIKRHS